MENQISFVNASTFTSVMSSHSVFGFHSQNAPEFLKSKIKQKPFENNCLVAHESFHSVQLWMSPRDLKRTWIMSDLETLGQIIYVVTCNS